MDYKQGTLFGDEPDEPPRKRRRRATPLPPPSRAMPAPRGQLAKAWCWAALRGLGRFIVKVGNKVVVEVAAAIVIAMLVAHMGFDAFGLKSKVPTRAKDTLPVIDAWEAKVRKGR